MEQGQSLTQDTVYLWPGSRDLETVKLDLYWSRVWGLYYKCLVVVSRGRQTGYLVCSVGLAGLRRCSNLIVWQTY